MSSGPDNPIGDMFAEAIRMHEMLLSFVKAGFTRGEALELVKTVIAEFVRNAKGSQ